MRRLLPALLVFFASAAAWAAGDAEESSSFDFWAELLNLALLVGVLIYVARKPVLEYFAGRRSEIQDNIERSEKLLTDAQERLAEWEAKALGLDAEVERIKDETRAAAERQGKDIIAAAEVTAERIRSGASAVADREVTVARAALRQEAADLAVEMAAKILADKVTDADRTRLVDEFITTLENGRAH